jgi:UMF1 family MFS transporter
VEDAALCHPPPMTTRVAQSPHAVAENRRHRRSWYWYDWANSAYVTTVGTVLLGPYLTAVAKEAACPGIAADAKCTAYLSVLSVPVDPGSLVPYTVTVATILSAMVLIFVGAIADRSPRPVRLLGGFAWAGALAASLMFFVAGSNWQLGVLLMIVAAVCLGSAQVVYDSLLCRIAAPDERDQVSSRGWALGYLGGGLLLGANLALVTLHGTLGLSTGMAVRLSLLSAGLWWGLFTLIPVIGMWNLRGVERPEVAREAGAVGGSLRQLRTTFGELRAYPQTLLFLLAYLFFNDGIQTVIGVSSLYGSEELHFSQSQLMLTILTVQFIAFGGALLFGKLAARFGAWRSVLLALGLWTVAVAVAFFIPERAFLPFLALGSMIGIVLGGSQALTRSLYSQMIPRQKEAEFFSLYQAMERGTSWFGTLTFGLVHQLTHSYRWAIAALVVFFAVGGLLLARVDVRKGIADAGNEVPRVV